MKKIDIAGKIYGPYNTIEVLSDRYRCDGADLPFSVVGQGVVSNVIDGDFPIEVAPIVVPQEVQMYQAREALIRTGIMPTQVDTIIATLPSPDKELAQNQWEYAATVKRYNSWVSQLAPLIPLTDAQIDDLFILAGTL